jgi:hypothetical protein
LQGYVSVPDPLAHTSPSIDADLEAQLDALMADIAGQAPAAAASPARPSAPAAAPAPAAKDDIVSGALAVQIQELLDHADAAPQGPSEAVAAGAGPASAAARSPTPPPPDIPAPGLANNTDDQTTGEVLRQIDEHLAQDADHAIAGDFETVPQVEAFEEQAAAERKAAAAAAGGAAGSANLAAEQMQVAAAPADGGIAAAPTADQAATVSGASSESPTESAAASAVPGPAAAAVPPAGATAADVARELDQDARTAPTPVIPAGTTTASVHQVTNTNGAAADIPAGMGPGPAAAGPKSVPTGPRTSAAARTGLLSVSLRRLLGAINRPLAGLSPTARSTVGYIGLLTLFNAVVLVLVTILKAHFKH